MNNAKETITWETGHAFGILATIAAIIAGVACVSNDAKK